MADGPNATARSFGVPTAAGAQQTERAIHERPVSPMPLRSRRLLRRVAVLLAIATAGMLVGVLVAPIGRRHYHLNNLRQAEPHARLEAMNTLAGLAVADSAIATPLVDALLAEAGAGDPMSPEAVRTIAVWAIRRSPSVRRRVEALLADADDARFASLGDWLARAGHWRTSSRPIGQLVRRERLHLTSPSAGRRVAALTALERLGSEAGPLLGDALVTALGDAAESVRRAVVTTAAACLEPETAVATVLLPALEDASPAVRREAVIMLGFVRPAALETAFNTSMPVGDQEVERALLWATRHTPAGSIRALARLGDGSAELRRLAAWALGYATGPSKPVEAVLVGLLGDDDPVTAARAAVALGRRRVALDDPAPLVALIETAEPQVQAAALFALGRCSTSAAARASAIAAARRSLETAIQTGRGAVAAAAVTALADLQDIAFLPVMGDLVAELADQPMLGYAAALAAGRLDASAGFEGLWELCASPVDEARELAVFRIGVSDASDWDRVRDGLLLGGDPLRGAAALALALGGRCRLTPDESLADWLVQRTDQKSPVFEPSWRMRAEYLGARLICGQTAAGDELDVYLLNENVSRMGLFVAALHTGDSAPMDWLLSDQDRIDVASFLGDARFIDVVAHYFPEAPQFMPVEDR
ncbi:MAG: hypothetical protein IID40_03430, partial [Planctomycetes bacterium]|nr:hypothetical protein [Planctomycetota bacterium]